MSAPGILFLIICTVVILFPSQSEGYVNRKLRSRRHPWMWTDDEWDDTHTY